MLPREALAMLGLCSSHAYNKEAIRKAWKAKLRLAHPDKNMASTPSATAYTQMLNEAKDTLFGQYEKRQCETEVKSVAEMVEAQKQLMLLEEIARKREIAHIQRLAQLEIEAMQKKNKVEQDRQEQELVYLKKRKELSGHSICDESSSFII